MDGVAFEFRRPRTAAAAAPIELLSIIPPIIAIIFVLTFARSVPMTDELLFVANAVKLHGATIEQLPSILPTLHWTISEHPIAVPVVLYALLGPIVAFDSRYVIGATVSVLFVLLWVLWRVRALKGWQLVAASVLVFNPSQYMTFMWGQQITFTLAVAFALTGLALLNAIEDRQAPTATAIRAFGGIGLITLGVLSAAPAAFAFPAAAAMMALKRFSMLRKVSLVSLPSAAFLVTVLLLSRSNAQFFDLTRSTFHLLTAFGAALVGSEVGMLHFGVDHRSMLGAGLAALGLATFIVAARQQQLDAIALPLAMAAFSAMCITVVGLSRLYLGNWHVQLAVPGLVGLIVAIGAISMPAWIRCVALAAISLPAAYGYFNGFAVRGPAYAVYTAQIEAFTLAVAANPQKADGTYMITPVAVAHLKAIGHPIFHQ